MNPYKTLFANTFEAATPLTIATAQRNPKFFKVSFLADGGFIYKP